MRAGAAEPQGGGRMDVPRGQVSEGRRWRQGLVLLVSLLRSTLVLSAELQNLHQKPFSRQRIQMQVLEICNRCVCADRWQQ